MNRFAAVAFTIGLVLWILTPIGVYVVLSGHSSDTQVETTRPAWATVTANNGPVSSDVGLALKWKPSSPLVAPNWDGVVQEVFAIAGSPVNSGSPIATISGIRRIAYASDVPFTRHLQYGDKGIEVASLNRLLAELAYAAPSGGNFTSETGRAVSKLAASLGVPDAAKVKVFDPSWVVYLAQPITVAEEDLVVGAPAPVAGSIIVKGTDMLSSATLVPLTVAARVGQMDDFDPDRDLTAETITSVAADADLFVGDTKVDLNEERDKVAVSSFPALVPLLGQNAKSIIARTETPASDGQWKVPSNSIFVSAQGKMCVLVERSNKKTSEAVSVATESNGLTVVNGDLSSRDKVALAPPASERQCT